MISNPAHPNPRIEDQKNLSTGCHNDSRGCIISGGRSRAEFPQPRNASVITAIPGARRQKSNRSEVFATAGSSGVVDFTASTTKEGFVMQSFRVSVVALAAAAAVPLLAATAYAGPGVPTGTSAAQCVRGCAVAKRSCVQTARTVSLACKADCRANSAPTALGACMRGCSDTFRASKDLCRTDQKSCIGDCKAGMPAGGQSAVDGSCLGSCGMELGQCAQGVVDAARTCIRGCRTSDDRPACLGGCAEAAQTGAEACASGFETCGTGCPPAGQ